MIEDSDIQKRIVNRKDAPDIEQRTRREELERAFGKGVPSVRKDIDFLNACFGGYKDDPMDKVVELNEFVNEGKEEDSHR